MAEIDEVEVISKSGIPFYYHSNSGGQRDDVYLLQASFITALSQFAQELKNGQIKMISMEKKHYLLTRSPEFIVIFTSRDETGPETLMNYQPQIGEVKNYLDETLLQMNIDLNQPNNTRLDQGVDQFHQYLLDKQLIQQEKTFQSSSFREQLNSLVFKSVGYEPGKCNIGRAERIQRLSVGLASFVISFVLYALILILSLPSWTVWILVIPNFMGFNGVLQYFYKFCVTNGLTQQYDMN